MKPTWAVVVPTFDRRAWVVEAVDSALAQESPPDEVVVVDDGSTDGTAAALERFGGRVVLLTQPRGGAAAAKNRGAAACRSEWIQFLDSDDRLLPHAVTTLREAVAARPAAGLVAYRARETDETGRVTDRVVGKRSPGERFTTESLLGRDAGGCSWFAVRRDAFEAVGGFDARLTSAEECDFVLRLSFETRLVGLPQALLLRRMHGSMLSGDREANARCWIRILERLRAEHGDWTGRNRRVFDRAWGKEHLRLGKALLRAGRRGEARAALRVAARSRPAHPAAWWYSLRAGG